MAESPIPIPTPTPTISIATPHSHDDPHQQPSSGLDVTVLLAAILCAFLCVLGLNSMLQCVFQCANRALTEPCHWIASRRTNSGLKKKEMVALPTLTYSKNSAGSSSPSSSSSSSSAAAASGCAICLADFCDGDRIRFLPICNHRFHVDCIDKWLLSHSSCPTCRHRLKSRESIPSLHFISV